MSKDSKVLIHPTAKRLERCRRLARVLRITKQMLEAVDKGEWLEVARLEKCRRQDFVDCLAQASAMELDSVDAFGEGLVALVCMNEDLLERLQHELRVRQYPLRDVSGSAYS